MYYIDSTSFLTATAVYTDELLTIKAPDGYYKFGSGYREQLGGLLLNSIECTTCIDCKQFVSFDYKTGAGDAETINITVTYTDCWGYNHTLQYNDLPTTYGQVINHVIDGPLCVKNGSVASTSIGFFVPYYDINSQCDITTTLVQSQLCTVGGAGSPTPTGCDINCGAVDSLSYVFIDNSVSGYLENDMIVYNTNSTLDLYVGDDLYYKIIYNNVVYGVRINNVGKIYELTYCNP